MAVPPFQEFMLPFLEFVSDGSHLSFDGDDAFVETCTEQYHLLRDYMLEHAEARSILGAID